MAVVCATCGAEVNPGAQFCAVCGTAVASSAGGATASGGFTPVNVPSQQAAPPPPPQAPPAAGSAPMPGYTQVNAGVPPGGMPPSGGYPPAAGYPPSAGYPGQPAVQMQSSGGGSAVKIILIILAVVVGLGILGAGAVGFMVWRVAHSIHNHARNGDFSISTPGGAISGGGASNFTADELGADIYPGAQVEKGGMRMKLPTGSIISGVFTTSDSKEDVVSFYKQKLGSDASVFDSSDSAMFTQKKGDHETVMVTVTSRTSENEGKTKIAIVHTTNKRPT